MKKRLVLILSLMAILSCFAFGCQDKDNEHIHEYSWYVSKVPTCIEKGVMEGGCDCGFKVFEEIAIDKEKHDYVWTVVIKQDCVNNGLKKGVCRLCNATAEESIPAGEHNYIWNIEKEATCVEEGSALGLCQGCFDTKNRTLEKKDHVYQGGLCECCGGHKNKVTEKIGYSIDEISEFVDVRYAFKDSVYFFINDKNLYARDDELSQFDFKIGDVLIDYEPQEKNDKIIKTIKNNEYESNGERLIIKVVYADNTIVKVGYFFDLSDERDESKIIKNVAINKDGYCMVTYEDDSFVCFGKLSHRDEINLEPSEKDDSIKDPGVYYELLEDQSGYGISTFLITNEEIVVPISHQGKPIVEVLEKGFYGNINIIKVDLGDDMRVVRNRAFMNCEKLMTITIPKTLEVIESSAFYNCTSLTKIIYEGTKEEWELVKKEVFWNFGVETLLIQCSNGNIIIE